MRGEVKDIVIIIPLYKNDLTYYERLSLNRTLLILQRYDFVFVKSNSFRPDFDAIIQNKNVLRQYTVENFEDHFFQSVKGYNKLLISEGFYERFRHKKYMLICQLDVYIFRDELLDWMNKGFDYLGSPWPASEIHQLQKTHLKRKLKYIRNVMKVVNFLFFNKRDYTIGNGGLSLRKVRKCLSFLRSHSGYATKWKANEDVFWSMLAPILNPFFRIPNLKQGLGFAFESDPSYFYRLNQNRLPFGTHAWEKHEPEFWQPLIDDIEKGKRRVIGGKDQLASGLIDE